MSMPVQMNIEQLHSALNAIRSLRSSFGVVFDALGSGIRAEHGDEGKEAKFMLELQEHLNTANGNLREVEQSIGTLVAPPGPFHLGNTAYLSQDITQDRQALYTQLVNSYKWTDKIHEYTSLAQTLLSQNSLKRSYVNSNSAKRRRTQTSGHNAPPQVVDNFIGGIDRLFGDMSISVSRPFASNALIQVSLRNVLKAFVAFKGLMIEWVVIKGHGEALDLWTESRHQVFRKVTENAHAAMLHFYSPTHPELAVRSFMTWLHSFNNLFTEPCKKCGNRLNNALPPTWRDFRTLEPFHEECKQ